MLSFHPEIHIPLFIMTNEFNRKHIESGFRANNFYGLREDQVAFFSQGSFPCIDDEGSCLMREKYRVFLSFPYSPDCPVAQRERWALPRPLRQWSSRPSLAREHRVRAHFLERQRGSAGKEWGPRQGQPGDPLFVGFCVERGSDVCVECVKKLCPEEQLSLVAQYQEKPFIAVTSEMSYRQGCRRKDDGSLEFPYGFICNSLMKLSFLEQCRDAALPP